MDKAEKKQRKLLKSNRKEVRRLTRRIRRAAKFADSFASKLPAAKDLKIWLAGQKPKVLLKLTSNIATLQDEIQAVSAGINQIGHAAGLELDVPVIKRINKGGKK